MKQIKKPFNPLEHDNNVGNEDTMNQEKTPVKEDVFIIISGNMNAGNVKKMIREFELIRSRLLHDLEKSKTQS